MLRCLSNWEDHPASELFQINQGKPSARIWRIINHQVDYKEQVFLRLVGWCEEYACEDETCKVTADFSAPGFLDPKKPSKNLPTLPNYRWFRLWFVNR